MACGHAAQRPVPPDRDGPLRLPQAEATLYRGCILLSILPKKGQASLTLAMRHVFVEIFSAGKALANKIFTLGILDEMVR